MFYNIIQINNQNSVQTIDENGFLKVSKSPILKTGILEYLGAELIAGGKTNIIDGVIINPDQTYKVFISNEELDKSKETFKGKPILNEHHWLGKEGDNVNGFQEGSIGDTVYIENGQLFCNLYFNNIDTIKQIRSHQKQELSASYTNQLKKSTSKEYDFEAYDIIGNHVALVEQGRCGKEVCVFNKKGEKMEKEKNIIKIDNDKEYEVNGSVFLVFNEQKIDLTDLLNKNKPGIYIQNASYKKQDEDEEEYEIDEDAEEVIGDDEEKEDKDEENDEEEEEEEEVFKKKDLQKMKNSIQAAIQKDNNNRIKAYNTARSICGDFDYSNLSEKDIYLKACNYLGLECNNYTLENAKTAIEVYNSLRVDNTPLNLNNSKQQAEKKTVIINY